MCGVVKPPRVDEWAPVICLRREACGTHSLRRTKAIIYQTTGNLRAVQPLLVHTKIESTVRYLGINVEDVLNTQPSPSTQRS
jgi:site-specific recombinase XerC